MINKLTFKNYKPFKEQQELDLKPITVLIGKNSSGKSAVAKLPSLLVNSLNDKLNAPLLLENEDIDYGAEFSDLVHGRARTGFVEFGIESDNETLNVVVGKGTGTKDLPQILNWQLENKFGTFKKQDGKFNGFVFQSNDPNLSFQDFDLKIDYIGPFRALPQRQYPPIVYFDVDKVGATGESAYQLLIYNALASKESLNLKVSNWYKEKFAGWGIRINEDKAPFYQVELTRNNGLMNVNIADSGQGMSQALPLVVRALMPAEKDTLIVIEQPELHLHPAAHGDLAELFVDSLSEGSKRYLIETHSQNFVLRLRRLVAQGTLKPDDLAIYFVDFDEESCSSDLKLIKVDESGEVDFWPENIFNESLDEVLAIRRAQKKK